MGKVLRNTHPRAECSDTKREIIVPKSLRDRVPLEINRHKRQVRGNGNIRSLQAVAFPLLRNRMIDLVDPKRPAPQRLAVSEGIESGSKDHILTRSTLDYIGQIIFRVPGA